MPRPKKVAIIGAGPSGLVTAKTLLHEFPRDTYAPTLFEKRHVVGGLWPTDATARTSGLIDPQMRTNLSRFTVSFSDFPWESPVAVSGDGDVGPDGGNEVPPMFPRAWQVGRYLVRYAERYLPSGVVRLRTEVVGVQYWGEREARWDVRWVEGGREHMESFDYLVVASGYFASPYVPEIPGLDAATEQTGLVVKHSSAVNNAIEIDRVLAQIDRSSKTDNDTDEQNNQGRTKNKKKIVVIGASMSGVETASALALHLSSARLSHTTSSDAHSNTEYEIHHVCSRPFWTVPYYLPHGKAIVPLDLAFYDMDRRPPGDIEYGFGPISSQQVNKTNEYFRRLLGSEYEKFGSVGVKQTTTATDAKDEHVSPSWTAIGDDYAEYIRSGMITTTLGRVIGVHPCEQTHKTRLDVRHRENDDVASMEDVSAIILATGFMPYTALSFLPEDVLSRLEFSKEDPFIPLILDGKGTCNATAPGLGFVGFYRGPYWGVMEMQARSLGETWSRAAEGVRPLAQENEQKEQERTKLRDLRCVSNRSQFPMGDYVGLMESFAREMGIERVSFQGRDSDCDNDRRGPVVPARYVVGRHRDSADVTLASLLETISPTPGSGALAAATAVFRALHGSWKYTTTNESDGNGRTTSGISTFYPRYASSSEYEKEYVCEEIENEGISTRSIYRLGASSSAAQVFVTTIDGTKYQRLELKFSHYQLDEEGAFILASGHTYPQEDGQDRAGYEYRYAFRLNGVAISSWECTISPGIPERTPHTRTVYTRPT